MAERGEMRLFLADHQLEEETIVSLAATKYFSLTTIHCSTFAGLG